MRFPRADTSYWIRLPNGQDAQALMKRAEDFQVSFRPGVLFSSQGGLRDYARLCFAFYEADQLTAGVDAVKARIGIGAGMDRRVDRSRTF